VTTAIKWVELMVWVVCHYQPCFNKTKGAMMIEPRKNIIYTCKKHGKATYFKIKKLELLEDFKNFVYVWFTEGGVSEKMWVKIRSGTQRRGFGTINNEATLLKNWKLNDVLFYETGRDRITRPVKK